MRKSNRGGNRWLLLVGPDIETDDEMLKRKFTSQFTSAVKPDMRNWCFLGTILRQGVLFLCVLSFRLNVAGSLRVVSGHSDVR